MSAPESAASERFERTLGGFQTVVRGASIVLVGTDLAMLAPTFRRPRLAWGAMAGILAHGVWGSTRLLSGRPDRALAMSEVPVAIALIAAERLSAGPTTPRTGPRPASDYMGNAALLHASEAAGLGAALPGLAALAAATFLNRTEERGRLGAHLVEVLLVADGLIANAFVRGLRAQAAAIDGANRRARQEAAGVAEEQEWRRQHRLVHDSVLQTLELIGGDWQVDEAVMARRIDLDLERLSRLLRRLDGPATIDIVELLSGVAAEFSGRGLQVSLDVSVGSPATPAEAADAIISAAREALTNVDKHSGVRRANLRVSGNLSSLRVEVSDDGVGFDPATTPDGFGLAESITGGLVDVGGWATVTAAPGHGVSISMGVPR